MKKSVKSLGSRLAIRQNKFSRRSKTRSIEQLEARHMLVAALWNNVIEPLNVDGDQGNNVSAIDALVVINELNRRQVSNPTSGLLPKQITSANTSRFVDTNCDGFASPIDALLVINHLNRNSGGSGGGFRSGGGTYRTVACSPQLVEGSNFVTEITRELTLPDSTSAIQVLYQAPEFDLTSKQSVLDAFEIELTDVHGTPLSLPFAPGRDAVFNWSEGKDPSASATASIVTRNAPQDSSLTINLNGIPAGTRIRAHARLVNNDTDIGTSIILRGFEVVDAPVPPSTGFLTTSPSSIDPDSIPKRLEEFTEFSASLTPSFGRSSVNGNDDELITELTVTNRGNFSVAGDILVVVSGLTSSDVFVLRPDGFLQDGRPYFVLSHSNNPTPLLPGQSFATRELRFRNSSLKQFGFSLSTLARINQAPTAFTSTPLESIESGRRYSYRASASDPEGQPLIYSLLEGPAELSIQSSTGVLEWNTRAQDIGSHRIVIRATDSGGLTVDQTFTLEVLESLQNRPPIFSSTPPTEAIASGSFEILTLPTAPGPKTAITGNFGSATPSIVTLSSRNQNLNLHAGLGNDRFGNSTSISVGLPPSNQELFKSGIDLDLGLPPYQNPTYDRNYLDGMTVADFNKDGHLDVVNSLRTIGVNDAFTSIRDRYLSIHLGQGDGTFQSPRRIDIPIGESSSTTLSLLSSKDFDQDGSIDLLGLDFANNVTRFVYARGKGDGTFEPTRSTTTNVPLGGFQVGDLNRDGKLDLIVLRNNYLAFGTMLGNGDGTFQDYAEFASHAGGGTYSNAFVLGDLDGDSDLDLASADWQRSMIDVYINDGNGSFSAGPKLRSIRAGATDQTPLSNPSSLCIGDFTGDGKPDIVFGQISGSDAGGGLALYVGDGTGQAFTYKSTESNKFPYRPINLSGDAHPIDIDKDGDLDVVFGSPGFYADSALGLSVAINNGAGKFQITNWRDPSSGLEQAAWLSGTGQYAAAYVADFNHDGQFDLLSGQTNRIFGSDAPGVTLILGTSSGRFNTASEFGLNHAAFGSVQFTMAGDFNNDGAIDLWGPQYQGVSVTALGNGDGTFRPSFTATPYIGNEALSPGFVADLNNDGKQDILWLGNGGVQGGPTGRYLAALGNGDGSFQISFAQNVAGSFYGTTTVQPGDFNGDGFIDFVARNPGAFGVGPVLDVLVNNPNQPGTFSLSYRLPLSNDNGTLAAKDFDHDGLLDVAFILNQGNQPPHQLRILKGLGDGTFTELLTQNVFSGSDFPIPRWMAAGDLNRDGRMDMVVSANYSRLGVLLGQADGTFSDALTYSSDVGLVGLKDIYLADMNNDGDLDVIACGGHGFPGRLSIRLGKGDGTFGPKQTYDLTDYNNLLSLADFDDDGRLDIATTSTTNSHFYAESVFLAKRDGLTEATVTDFNRDGFSDMLAVNSDNGHVTPLESDRQGGFIRHEDLIVGDGAIAISSGDLNEDGLSDFVTANRTARTLSIGIARSSGSYTITTLDTGTRASDLELADVNRDGHADILILDSASKSLSTWSGNGLGGFSTPQTTLLGDVPDRLELADANGDGFTDALITFPQSHRIGVFFGNGADSFLNPQFTSLNGKPSDVTAQDFNQDGLLDIAVSLSDEDQVALFFGLGGGRLSLPQKLSVGDEPTSLTATDTNLDGLMDIVVTNQGESTISVIVNRFDPSQILSYQPEVSDPDGDPIKFTMVQAPGGMLVDAATGSIRWAPSIDQIGDHSIVLEASDGRGGVATQAFTISVQATRANSKPIITSLDYASSIADQPIQHTVRATDSDHDQLRYEIVSGPSGARIDPVTGILEWDPRGSMFSFGTQAEKGYAVAPHNASQKATNVTIEGWFRFESTENQILVYKAGAGSEIVGAYGLRYQWGALRGRIGDGSFSGQAEVALPWQPPLGQWTHLAFTFDSSSGTLRLFVNGEERISQTTNRQIGDSTTPIQIGGISYDTFEGDIAQLRIWNQALEVDVLRSRMFQLAGPGQIGLVADYRFAEGDSLNVLDSSGNNNHARIAGVRAPERQPGLSSVQHTSVVVRVTDGRGGESLQTIQLAVTPAITATVSGQLFLDSNRDGVRQVSEAVQSTTRVFVDLNQNGVFDSSEPSAITNANGQFVLRTTPDLKQRLAVEPIAGWELPPNSNVVPSLWLPNIVNLPLSPSQPSTVRGSIDLVAPDDPLREAAYWKVFADLDRDKVWDSNEPFSMVDRFGKYALDDLAAGSYSIRLELERGWKPSVINADAHDVVLGNASELDNINFSVTAIENAIHTSPVFLRTIHPTAIARQAYATIVTATSPDGSKIRYSLIESPEGLAIDPESGRIVWNPTTRDEGEHRIVVAATNASGQMNMLDLMLTVAPPNSVPVVFSQYPRTAYLGHAWTTVLEVQDAESTQVALSIDQGPTSAHLDAQSGVLRWTPAANEIGTVTFVVRATDGQGTFTTYRMDVDVQQSIPDTTPFEIRAPRLTTSSNERYLARTSGVDRLGDPLTVSLLAGPSSLTMDGTGNIEWLPTESDQGSHGIRVLYRSVTGQTEEHQFSLLVQPLVANSAPVFISHPTTKAILGEHWFYLPEVSDANLDSLSFELIEAPGGMSIHPRSGRVHWLPETDQIGQHSVSIRVTDPFGGTETQSFILSARRYSSAPIITSIPETEAVVGRSFITTVDGMDPENDPLFYELVLAPSGMTIDSLTGDISWTPALGQIGIHPVIVRLRDGTTGSATQGFSVRVSAGERNFPPTISSQPPMFGAVGTFTEYQVHASDPEGSTVRYSLRRFPTGMEIDPQSGRVTWTPTSGQAGRVLVSVAAEDPLGGTAIQSFTLDVLPTNHIPQIVSTAPVSIAAGAKLTYDVLVVDPDLDPLTFRLIGNVPSGATVDTLGRVRWQTSTLSVGTQSFQVQVSDTRGGTTQQTISLSVVPDTTVPQVTVLPTPGGWPWDGPIVVFVSAVDNVAVTDVELKVNGRIVPLTAERMAILSYEDFGPGALDMVATAKDASGNIGTGTGFAGYRNPDIDHESNPDVPRAVISSPTESATVTGLVEIHGTADGARFQTYQLSYANAASLQFIVFASGSSAVTDGLLGTWDTTMLENDAYVIRLEVTDQVGSSSVSEITVGLSGNLKLGNFRLSFQDLKLDVSGIPVVVTRTYDSLRSDRKGEFGFGWRMEYRDTDLRTSLPRSGLEDLGIYPAMKSGTKVYLTLPGAERQGFTFTPEFKILPGFGRGNNLTIAFPRFTPDKGVTSRLSTRGGSLLVNEFGELYASGGIPWNPAAEDFGGYTLTTEDGMQYKIDGASGLLQSVADRNGNQVVFEEQAIRTADNTTRVQIERNGDGRITAIVDPSGNRIQYGYSSAGDLVEVTDRDGAKTSMQYQSSRPHFLTQILDPLGRSISRTEYDSNGRLSKTVNGYGAVTTVSIDPQNRLEELVDALGRKTLQEYDSRGNIVRTVNAEGGVQLYSYDDLDNQIQETTYLGQVITKAYDSAGNLVRITNGLGNSMTFGYDSLGNVTSITDPTGGRTIREYDDRGNLISETNASGDRIRYVVDSRGKILSETNEDGDTTRFEYNAAGFLTAKISPRGNRTQYVRDAKGDLLAEEIVTSSGTFVTTYTLDPEGRIVRERDPLGNERSNVYDTTGKRIVSRDERGFETRYSYDTLGNLIEAILPDSTAEIADNPRTTFTYDVQGQRISQTDPLGFVTNFEYDRVGRLTNVTLPPDSNGVRPIQATRYAPDGQVASKIDPLGNQWQYRYDSQGRLAQEIDPSGNATRYTYDANNRPILSIDAENRTTRFQYDALGRQVAVTMPGGATYRTDFSAGGRKSRVTDAKGNATTYLHDSDGNLVRVIDSLGNVQSYEFDERNLPTAYIDALSNRTEFRYDAAGRKVATRLPMGEQTLFRYDSAGYLVQETDAAGGITNYVYDAMGQIVLRKHSDASEIQWQYNRRGEVIAEITSAGTVAKTYDALGRVVSVVQPGGITIQNTYDLAGRRIQIQSLAGSVAYTYDPVGRVQSATDWTGGITRFEYDRTGRQVKLVHANGTEERTQYDAAGHVIQVVTTLGNSVLESFTNVLDITGNRIEVVQSNGRTTRYAYDAMNRITEETITNAGATEFTARYAYDAAGNRTRVTNSQTGQRNYLYDANGRLVKTSGDNFLETRQYDAIGQLIEKTSAGATTHYRWNGLGRLAGVDSNGDGSLDVTYQYDADGIRLAETVAGETRRFVVDDWNESNLVLAELTTGNQVDVAYLVTDRILSEQREGTVLVLHTDAAGHTRFTTNQQGAVTATVHYDSLGRIIVSTGDLKTQHLFAGERRDPQTGLNYFRARYLDPTVGAFVSPDPFPFQPELPMTANTYAYAWSNSQSYRDPSGNSPLLNLVMASALAGTVEGLLTLVFTRDVKQAAGAVAHGFAITFLIGGFFMYAPAAIGAIGAGGGVTLNVSARAAHFLETTMQILPPNRLHELKKAIEFVEKSQPATKIIFKFRLQSQFLGAEVLEALETTVTSLPEPVWQAVVKALQTAKDLPGSAIRFSAEEGMRLLEFLSRFRAI